MSSNLGLARNSHLQWAKALLFKTFFASKNSKPILCTNQVNKNNFSTITKILDQEQVNSKNKIIGKVEFQEKVKL